jgi:hypothetical protein
MQENDTKQVTSVPGGGSTAGLETTPSAHIRLNGTGYDNSSMFKVQKDIPKPANPVKVISPGTVAHRTVDYRMGNTAAAQKLKQRF